MSEEVSVNLMLVSGTGYNVSYLAQGREVSKVDMEEKLPNVFKPGAYPFYWPGNVSFFGGGIKDGESPQEAFKREVKEELGIDLTDEKLAGMEQIKYDWKKDTNRIIGEANEIFRGHVSNFLGFGLDDPLPNSTLNKGDRERYAGKNLTYRDWLYGREEGDYFFVGNIGEQVTLQDREGAGSIWLPHWVARSVSMVPVDKIGLLDDMTKRVKSGELEIRVVRQ